MPYVVQVGCQNRSDRRSSASYNPRLLPEPAGLIGRTLAHYKITAAIGSGGMGEVYRATDLKLGRDIALKVLPQDVAEVLYHGQPGEADAQARPGGLGHLAVHQGRLADDARLLHLEPEVVPLAGALADAGEHRHAAVLQGDVVDQLHDHDGLADASAAKRADLAAFQERADQIDDLDSRRQDLR